MSLGHQVGHQSCVAKLGSQVQAATSLTIPTQRFGMVTKVLLSPGHQVGQHGCVAKLGGQVQAATPLTIPTQRFGLVIKVKVCPLATRAV